MFRLSKAENGNYTKELLQTQFQKAVYNGLRHSGIRMALRATLKQEEVSDEDLRDEIKDLMMNEADHESKMEDVKEKAAAVQLVDTGKAAVPTKPKKDPVVAQVTQQLDSFKVGITKDITDLKKEMMDRLRPPVNSNNNNNNNTHNNSNNSNNTQQ